MTEWDHYSLEWIHKIRERNYQKTKDEPIEEVIKKSVDRSKKVLKYYKRSE